MTLDAVVRSMSVLGLAQCDVGNPGEPELSLTISIPLKKRYKQRA